ncbi:uncharacterized protein LOC123273742 [Cotesia glomerata]|uniref:uncharacterized protein LOC123273742 n=1 Tax=Cotesia glomerata TaxID=32391 RepID=UPI001D00A4D2|nr:uncharacterized protein LOC123273742 [Cotesia glomerata]
MRPLNTLTRYYWILEHQSNSEEVFKHTSTKLTGLLISSPDLTGCVINQGHKDPASFLQASRDIIINKVQSVLKDLAGLKVNVEFFCTFRKPQKNLEERKSFVTKSREILPAISLQDWYSDHVHDKLLQRIQDFEHEGSGWSLHGPNSLMVTMSRFTPTQVGKSTFVTLPKDIHKKNAVVNIQNKDEFCFLWCVNAALHPPVLNPELPEKYQHFSNRLNYKGIEFPIKLNYIPKFEKMNNLSINVYGIESEFTSKKSEKSFIIPLYLSNSESKIPAIHLMMIKKSVNYTDNLGHIESVYYFAWIHNLSGLITKQITKDKHKLYICDRCLNHFKQQKSYQEHISDCFKSNKVRMNFPTEKNRVLKFKDFKSKDPVPFVVYADLECTLEPQGDDPKKVHKHVPHSIAYYIHCSYDNTLSKFELNRSPDCINWFVKQLESFALDFEKILKNPIKMNPLTKEQQDRHSQATVCHICQKPITSPNDKVYDHCHFTGNYRNAAHKSCNVNYQKSTIIPIVFHNLSSYDSHFIIKSLATVFEGGVTLLPINKERYLSFTKSVKNTSVSLRFIDSFRFMASSLEKLASYLDDNDKKITQLHYPDPDKFKLATCKGVFLYEYIDNIDRR